MATMARSIIPCRGVLWGMAVVLVVLTPPKAQSNHIRRGEPLPVRTALTGGLLVGLRKLRGGASVEPDEDYTDIGNTEEIWEMYDNDREWTKEKLEWGQKGIWGDRTFAQSSMDFYNLFEKIGLNRSDEFPLEPKIEMSRITHEPVRNFIMDKWQQLQSLSKQIQKKFPGLKYEEAEKIAIQYLRLLKHRPIDPVWNNDKDFLNYLHLRGTGRTLKQGIPWSVKQREEEEKWEDYRVKRRRAKRWMRGGLWEKRKSSDFDTTTTADTESNNPDAIQHSDHDGLYNVWKKPEGWDEINVTAMGLYDPWDRAQKKALKKKMKAYYNQFLDPNVVLPDEIQRERAIEAWQKRQRYTPFEKLDDDEKMIHLMRDFNNEIGQRTQMVKCLDLGALRDYGGRLFREIQNLDQEKLHLARTRNYKRGKLVIDFVQGGSRMAPHRRWMVEDTLNYPLGKYTWTSEKSIFQEAPEPCGFYGCECGEGPWREDPMEVFESEDYHPDPLADGTFYKFNLSFEPYNMEDQWKDIEADRVKRQGFDWEKPPWTFKGKKPVQVDAYGNYYTEEETAGLKIQDPDSDASTTEEEVYLNLERDDPGVLARQFGQTKSFKARERRFLPDDEGFGVSSGERSAEDEFQEEINKQLEDDAENRIEKDAEEEAHNELLEQKLAKRGEIQTEEYNTMNEAELDAAIERQQFGA